MESNKEPDQIFKVVILGDASVGKSCFYDRYVYEKFSNSYISTIGVNVAVKFVESTFTEQTGSMFSKESVKRSTTTKLSIWDIAGQDKFATMRKSYYGDVCGAFLLYDPGVLQSFKSLDTWRKEVNAAVKNKDYAPYTIVIATKQDIKNGQRVFNDQGMKYATAINADFIPISSKEGWNIENAFNQMTRRMLLKSGKIGKNQYEEIGKASIKEIKGPYYFAP